MREYVYEASFGNTKKEVKLSAVFGVPGGAVHLYIDKFYQGEFTRRNDTWVWLSNPSDFTADDIQILIEIIEEHFNEQRT